MNRVILMGNLGSDPELKYTTTNQAVLRIRLATTETYVDKQGQKHDRTEWHSVQVWGKRGEALNRILSKGARIIVEGRISYRSWDDQATGQKRYATDIVATDIHLAGGTRRDGSQDRGSGGGGGREPGDDFGEGGGGYGGGDSGDDADLPF